MWGRAWRPWEPWRLTCPLRFCLGPLAPLCETWMRVEQSQGEGAKLGYGWRWSRPQDLHRPPSSSTESLLVSHLREAWGRSTVFLSLTWPGALGPSGLARLP